MALEPITRQEQIIAGKNLEPITRMERFLKEYGGGSGGGGVGSWDDLSAPMPTKFLPDGVPYVEEDVLLEETSAESFTDPTFGEAWMITGAVPHLTVGETYTVTYNGTPYKCVCQAAPDGIVADPNAVAMGNLAAIGGTDTGEPFAMLIMADYQRLVALDFVGSTAVKVGILGGIPHKIDPRCLPDNIGGGIYTAVFDLVMNDSGVTVTAKQPYEEVYSQAIDLNTFVRGVAYLYTGVNSTTPFITLMLTLVSVDPSSGLMEFNNFAGNGENDINMFNINFYSDGSTTVNMSTNVSA